MRTTVGPIRNGACAYGRPGRTSSDVHGAITGLGATTRGATAKELNVDAGRYIRSALPDGTVGTQVFEGAAKIGKNADGLLTPGQLNTAVQTADKSARKRAVARGEALMQDLGSSGGTCWATPVRGPAGLRSPPRATPSPATSITAGGAPARTFRHGLAGLERLRLMASGPVVVNATTNASVCSGIDTFAVNGAIGFNGQLNCLSGGVSRSSTARRWASTCTRPAHSTRFAST